MNKHGNLYWNIQFTALHVADDGFEETDISVKGRDFAEVYRKAAAMYNAIIIAAHPNRVYCASVYLRDDGSLRQEEAYGIYTTNHISDENLPAFFSAGPEKCMALTWRV